MADSIQGNWNEIKGKVREMWDKLTEDDVTKIKGDWEQLAGKLERAYGYSKERAKEEVEKFKSKFH